MSADDTRERFVSTMESPPMYIGEVEETMAREKRYREMRYRLAALRDSMLASATEVRSGRARMPKSTGVDDASIWGNGLLRDALDSNAENCEKAAASIQNILDGRDP